MSSTNRGTVSRGFAWSFAERMGSQGVTALVSIILARIIAPEEFGIVAAITIFTNIATTFATSGFSHALIQKKDADDVDFSSMFYFNLVFSVIIFLIINLCAPYMILFVNQSYDRVLLTKLLKVLSVGIVFSSFNSFYHAILSKRLEFKKIFFVTLTGTVISAVIGITMAYMGYGVYALLAQSISQSVFNSILYIIFSKWYPKLKFSFIKLKSMLGFGGKLMVAGTLSSVYNEVNSMIISNQCTSEDLAFYKKGTMFPKLIALNILSAVNTVFFPLMAKMNTNEEYKACMKKYNKYATYIITPMMVGMAAVAYNFVAVILTEAWLPCVIFLQIYCIDCVWQPIGYANLQYWKAAGHGTLYLVTDIIKKIAGFGLSILAVVLGYGALGITVAGLLTSLIAVIINMIPGKRLVGYSMGEQILDVLPQVGVSLVMGAAVYFIGFALSLPLIVELIIQIIVGFILYLVLSYVFRLSVFKDLLGFVKAKRSKG